MGCDQVVSSGLLDPFIASGFGFSVVCADAGAVRLDARHHALADRGHRERRGQPHAGNTDKIGRHFGFAVGFIPQNIPSERQFGRTKEAEPSAGGECLGRGSLRQVQNGGRPSFVQTRFWYGAGPTGASGRRRWKSFEDAWHQDRLGRIRGRLHQVEDPGEQRSDVLLNHADIAR